MALLNLISGIIEGDGYRDPGGSTRYHESARSCRVSYTSRRHLTTRREGRGRNATPDDGRNPKAGAVVALNLGRWTCPYAHVLDRDSYRYEDRQPHESPESEAAPLKVRNPEEVARESTVISSTKAQDNPAEMQA